MVSMSDADRYELEVYQRVPAIRPEAEVGWRRDGTDTELQFNTPIGDGMWRRNAVPAGSIPFWSSVGWGTLGTALGGAVAAAPLPLLAAVDPFIVAAAGAAALVGGWFFGRHRQKQVHSRNHAIENVAEALSQSYSVDLRGPAGKTVKARVRETLRTGEPGTVSTFTGRGHASFRVDPAGDHAIRISPFVRESNRNSFIDQVVEATAMPITLGKNRGSLTPEADARMEKLEHRLRYLEKAGAINSSHPSFHKLVTLKSDRMTEYRALAARIAGVKRIGTPEALETAVELELDLDRVVELMRRGVDELEHEVLGDARRDTDAHLDFLRQKYGHLVTPESYEPEPVVFESTPHPGVPGATGTDHSATNADGRPAEAERPSNDADAR